MTSFVDGGITDDRTNLITPYHPVNMHSKLVLILIGIAIVGLCSCTKSPQAEAVKPIANPTTKPEIKATTSTAASPTAASMVKSEIKLTSEPPVVLAAPAGMGDGWEILVFGPSSRSGKEIEMEHIELAIPTSPTKEFGFYRNSEGYFLLMSRPDDVKGTRFGELLMCDGYLCFKQAGEPWVRVDWDSGTGTIYQEVEGKAIAIGETHRSPYKSETGEEDRVSMCKWQGKDDEWCFESGGKVYLKKSDDKITQIAWIGWRVVTPPKGEKLLVLMTKGMDKDAKWQGKHDGKLYIEK